MLRREEESGKMLGKVENCDEHQSFWLPGIEECPLYFEGKSWERWEEIEFYRTQRGGPSSPYLGHLVAGAVTWDPYVTNEIL